MKTAPWSLLAAVALVAGCAAQPQPTARQQQLVVAPAAAGTALSSAPQIDWPTDHWWTAFADPQLDQLMQRALAGSPHIAAASARISQARAQLQVANAALLPSIEGSADFDYTRFSHAWYLPSAINGYSLFDAPVWNNSVGAVLSYRLDFWGRDKAGVTAARDRVLMTQYQAQDARLSIETALLNAYLGLAYTYELQDNGQRILADEHRTLELAQRRLAGGLGTEMEIQQASATVADTEGELEQLANRITLLQTEIATLCGDPPAAAASISRPVLTLPGTAPGLPSRLPATLLGHRPDVLARLEAIDIATQGVRIARTAFYPDVNLEAFAGVVGLGFGELLNGRAIAANAGPAITLPIFEGGRLRGQLAGHEAVYDQAVAAYNATLLQALREVTDQLDQYRSLLKLRERRQQALQHALRAHELALTAFRSGLTDYLNVLQTENEVSRARNHMAQVSFEQLTTLGALDAALGGGMPALEPTPHPADGALAQVR